MLSSIKCIYSNDHTFLSLLIYYCSKLLLSFMPSLHSYKKPNLEVEYCPLKLKLICLCVWNFYIYTYIQEWVKLMIFFLMSLFELIRVMLTSQYELDGSPFFAMAGKNLYIPAWPIASKAGGTCLWNHLALPGASVRNSAHGKGHEEGGLAYAKAWSSLRKPPVPEHLPQNQSLFYALLHNHFSWRRSKHAAPRQ